MSTSPATLHLRVLGQELAATVQLPERDLTPAAMLPIAYAITDAVGQIAAAASAQRGSPVSCRRGCAACCRQLVLVAPVEAHALAALVAEMPAPRQAKIRERFAAAIRRLRDAGLVAADSPDHAPVLPASVKTTRAQAVDSWLDAYFGLAIDCPFLEDESCSIYAHRPAICREYLIVTPPENCSAVGRKPTVSVEMPVLMSDLLTCFGNDAEQPRMKIPLPFALAWAEARSDEQPRPAPAAKLLTDLLKLLDADALTAFSDRSAATVRNGAAAPTSGGA